MLHAILSSVPWIFSGIGVFLIILTLNWLQGRRKPSQQRVGTSAEKTADTQLSTTSADQSHTIYTNDTLSARPLQYSSRPSPDEIFSDISNRPPLQRSDAGNHYSGLLVRWRVAFAIAERYSGEKVGLYCRTDYGVVHHVRFNVSLLEYPQLKILHEGEKFWVSGKIEAVDKFNIWLKNVVLDFSA